MKPRGSQPAISAVPRCRIGALRLLATSFHDPGPIGGGPLCRRKVAPAARAAVEAGRPSAPCRSLKESPFEWATMNHGGTPQASRPPIIEPALVPTMYSAVDASQPVSRAIASRPPVSHAPPMTPPAPSTSPTLGPCPLTYRSVRPCLSPCQWHSFVLVAVVVFRRIVAGRALVRGLDVELVLVWEVRIG